MPSLSGRFLSDPAVIALRLALRVPACPWAAAAAAISVNSTLTIADLRFRKHGAPRVRGNEHWTGMSRISDFFPPRRLTALARLLAATSVAALLAGPALAGPTDPVTQVDPLISGSTQLPVVQGAAPQVAVPQAAQAARSDLTADGQPLDTPLPAYEPVSPGPVDPSAAKPTKRSSALDVLDEETTTQAPKSAAARRRALATKAARASENTPTPTPRPKSATSGTDTATDGSSTTDGTTTGTVRAPKMTADEIPPVDKRAERELPIEGLTPLPDENPFAPVGVRVGSFILRPSLEQGVTATSNADSSATGESAILSETTLRLNAVSDWSRHSATLDAYGTFRKSLSGEELKETSAGIDATVGLDFSRRPARAR